MDFTNLKLRFQSFSKSQNKFSDKALDMALAGFYYSGF